MAGTRSQAVSISSLLASQSGSIRKFQKVPELADAIQFQGWSNAGDIFKWQEGFFYVPTGYPHRLRTTEEYDAATGHPRQDAPEFLVFKGKDEDYRLDLDTWIVKTEKGELYFFTNEHFAESYIEKVQ